MLLKECRVEQIWLRTGDAMADVLIAAWEMIGFNRAILVHELVGEILFDSAMLQDGSRIQVEHDHGAKFSV